MTSRLKKAIESRWGERCDETAEGCPICGAWAEYDGIAAMREALEPFARVAEHDIGAYEHDDDRHVHMEKHNIADRLTVGDFRRALSAISQVKDEEQ